MKNILITGGAGFIGHHLIEGLLKNTNWNIILVDCLTYAGNLNRLININCWDPSRIKFIYHDLRAPISKTTHKFIGKVNYIWHLAAESDVGKSLDDSIPFVQSNIVGTANLLEYIKNYQPDIERYIYFSTDEVFGPAKKGVFYKEGDTCNPSNPYAGSKEGAEAISKSFAFSFKIPVTITRTMNVFGERQHPEKFVPKTVKAILNRKKIYIHGLPENISSRCWIHARNVCDALLFITEKGEFIEKKYQNDKQHGIYHIVGQEKDVLYLANRISRIIRKERLKNSEIEFIDFHSTRPGHDLRYALSGEKLKSNGFKYRLNLEDGFDKTIKWMIKLENRKWLNL